MCLHIIIQIDYIEDNHNCFFSDICVGFVRYGFHEVIVYYNYMYNLFLIWCGVQIRFSGNMYMFILTKLPYILHLIIIYSCCMLWGFNIYFTIWPVSISLGLCGCYTILFHGSINIISLVFDGRHFWGVVFHYPPRYLWSDSWYLPVFIDIDLFYVAGILLQDILILDISYFLMVTLLWWIHLVVLFFICGPVNVDGKC